MVADLVQIRDAQQKKRAEKFKNKKLLIIIAGIVLLGMAALFIVTWYWNHRCYDSYETAGEVPRNDSGNMGYMYMNGDIIKYSRSGINAMDGTGKVLWSGGFEMTQPQVDTCGDYIVVADITGKQFYVYNGEDEGQSIETALPIVRAKVAANGMVAVLLEDTDSNVLNIYNPYNTTTQLLVEIPTNVSEEGYPLDFDISPDGASVATSYLTITGNKMENRVGIYNFTEVGQDKNTLVGGMELGESMVACVEFVEEDEVAVFHQGGVALFGHMKQPELLGKLEFQQEIASVACNEKYIAVVTRGEDDSRELHMYDHKGKEKLSHPVSYEYSDMKLYRDEIFFTSSRSCHILRANGQEKFNCDFPDGLDTVFPTGSGRHYIVIEPEVIRKIKLVKK